MHPILKVDISELTVSERIQLAEDLWDSILTEGNADVPLSESQKQELDRRLELYRQNPQQGSSWEEVKQQLLSKYQPRIIHTEAENDYFLEVVEELLARRNLTPEENTILDLLVKLIEDFEDQHYQLNKSTPRSRMLHLMEAQDKNKESLISIFGSIENVDKVINGELEITSQQALELGNLLHIDASLFLNE